MSSRYSMSSLAMRLAVVGILAVGYAVGGVEGMIIALCIVVPLAALSVAL